MRALMWFRNDLRAADNTALERACAAAADGVVGVFAVLPVQWHTHHWGAAKADFVLRSVAALSTALAERGIPLRILRAERFADLPAALLELAQTQHCERLYFNTEYELDEAARDAAVVRRFEHAGFEVRECADQTVLAPAALRTTGGGFYRVYTPFRRAWMAALRPAGAPIPKPPARPARPVRLGSDPVPDARDLLGPPPPGTASWAAGEPAARDRLDAFVAEGMAHYHEHRDRPDHDGTSGLSPYLACGVLSARQCLDAALTAAKDGSGKDSRGATSWINQLIWREFYRHVLVGYPRVCRGRAFRAETERLPWSHDEAAFLRWSEGRTGVPIVDAGMRQLAHRGWMHNRLRMIVAMYLTKDLFIDWRWGERFFMQHLIDGDFANNNGGWQWAASTGTDAVPYFRVFNPATQSRRFDPEGNFIRRYCPELRHLDRHAIHDPGLLAPSARARLDYPPPMVDHDAMRRRTVARFRALRKQSRRSG